MAENTENKDKEKELDSPQQKHTFKIWKSFLIWFAIALPAVGLVLVIMYKNPDDMFKGYEQAKTTLTVVTAIFSLIISGIALYVNWITTSLLLLLGFKAGGNKEVTYRSVLYYFLKNSWVFAVWIVIMLLGTLITGFGFITSPVGIIISSLIMLGFYLLIFKKISNDFTIKKPWVYVIFAALIAAVIALSMYYSGTVAQGVNGI